MSRCWEMFAAPMGNGDWTGIGNRWYARAHADNGMPIPVLVTEDPEGNYLGWLETPDDEPWDDEPSMIVRKEIFSIQFPYGPEEEEKAGRGHAIPLTITERTVG